MREMRRKKEKLPNWPPDPNGDIDPRYLSRFDATPLIQFVPPSPELARIINRLRRLFRRDGQKVREESIQLLLDDKEAWNDLRESDPMVVSDLRGAKLAGADLSSTNLMVVDLRGADLRGTNFEDAIMLGSDFSRAQMQNANLNEASLDEAVFYRTDLTGANLSNSQLERANFSYANLTGALLQEAWLHEANLSYADLGGANLIKADLFQADLSNTNFREAVLDGARLEETRCMRTDFTGASIINSRVHGIASWGVKLKGTKQQNLRVTPFNESVLTVDSLDDAQFLYNALENERLGRSIDTLSEKLVLILGKFSERKVILETLKTILHQEDCVPVIYDFDVQNRDWTETVDVLSRLAGIVFADLTDGASIGWELRGFIGQVHNIVQPIIQKGKKPFSMFENHTGDNGLVLPIITYDNSNHKQLTDSLSSAIFPAQEKLREMRQNRR